MTIDASEALRAGVDVLACFMRSHRFIYISTVEGRSSGGNYTKGEFRRENRCLDLSFRYSLGLVTYRMGSFVLSHEDYMWSAVNRRWAAEYPGFSADPIDGFRHLLSDLQQHCSDFLEGTDADFERHVHRVEVLKKTSSRLP